MSHPEHPSDPSLPTGPGADDVVGPELRDWFRQTVPPEPADSEWDRVGRAIEMELPAGGPSWRTVGISLAAGVLLAVGAIGLTTAMRDKGAGNVVSTARPDDPFGEFPALAMAGEDDVEIHRVREGGDKVALVGRSPIPDVFTWAGPRDVWLWSTVPDEMYGFEPRMSGGFDEMPVIWADDSER